MCTHDGMNAAVHGGPEADQFGLFNGFPVFLDHGQGEVGIHIGVAVTGEVLAGRKDAFLPEPLNICFSKGSDFCRLC